MRAPGRRFWEGVDVDVGQLGALPVIPASVDLSKPNTTRLGISQQLFTIYLNEGNNAVTAQALADARALAMVP